MPARKRSENTVHRTQPLPLAKKVGGRIRELRKASGFNFDAFVEETGLGRGYISELERGLVNPSLTTLHRVAKALELTMTDVVAGDTLRERVFAATRELPPRQLKRLLAEIEEMLDGESG